MRTKPAGLTDHGGGPKFVPGGEVDARWQAFLKDYALTVHKDGYRVSDLLPIPKRRSWLSQLQLRITDLPETWNERFLTVTLHKVNSNGSVDELPVARADSRVNPKTQTWQHSFTVYAPLKNTMSEADWSEPIELPQAISRGKYIVRVASMTDQTILGTYQVEAPWPPGYQPPKILSWKEHQD